MHVMSRVIFDRLLLVEIRENDRWCVAVLVIWGLLKNLHLHLKNKKHYLIERGLTRFT